jgi:hypothetical protein
MLFRILGSLGIGGVLVLTVFVFALVMIARGTGTGPAKGLATGCLSLVFGGMILAIGGIGMVYNAMMTPGPFPTLPADVFPSGFSHPTVLPQESWKSYFLPSNWIVLLIAVPVVMLLGVWGFMSWRNRQGAAPGEKTGPPHVLIGVLVLIGLAVVAVAWRGNGRFYPASSLSADFRTPVIGRVEFKFTHPEAVTGGSKTFSYDVKQGGDTQWVPRSESSLMLKGGQTVSFKSRVDASFDGVPRAMVESSRKAAEWEMNEKPKEMALGTGKPGGTMVFANGLRVSIQWRPVAE